MSDFVDDPNQVAERFRPYLRLLADAQIDRGRGLGLGIDASDVVQQTLLDAFNDRDRFRGHTEAERLAWLRRLLACNIADAARAVGRDKRDIKRVQSLEQALDASSARLENWLAIDQTSPSQHAERNDAVLRLANALAALPEDNRKALVLRHCHGLGLAEISEELQRTPQAVAGLLKRGLAALRQLMPDCENRETP